MNRQQPQPQPQLQQQQQPDTSNSNILFSLNSNIIRYEEYDDNKKGARDEKPRTAHDWKPYRAYRVFDDGTISFFWYGRPNLAYSGTI